MTPHERQAKVAFVLLVEVLGGLEAAAGVARRGRSVLQEYGSLHHPERFAPLDVVMRLEAVAGQPLVTEVLARAAGFGLAGDDAEAEGCEIAALRGAVRTAADFQAEAFDAAADGQVDDAEGHRLERVMDRMRRAMGAVSAVLRRRRKRRRV